jgi:hypothetical protein
MLYSTLLFLSFCMDFGIAETGSARGSPPGTTTEVLRFGVPFAEIRIVSDRLKEALGRLATYVSIWRSPSQTKSWHS